MRKLIKSGIIKDKRDKSEEKRIIHMTHTFHNKNRQYTEMSLDKVPEIAGSIFDRIFSSFSDDQWGNARLTE